MSLNILGQIGKLGEDLAALYLAKQGYIVVERNFQRKYGEIDIIAEKDGVLQFIEVKSVSYETQATNKIDKYRPEDNMHGNKIKRLKRIISVYLAGSNCSDFMFHILTVKIDKESKTAKIGFMNNIIL